MRRKYLFFVTQDYSYPILRPLQKEILARGDEVRWFLYGNELTYSYLNDNETRIISIKDTIKYAPDAIFVPGNVVPSFIPGLKVQVFHGLPSTKRKKNGELYHFIIRGMFDLYCTQGPSSTKKFQELAEKHKFFSVEETGWCKLDPLFTSDNRQKIKKNEKVILFASTFSPRFSKAEILFPFIKMMVQKYPFSWHITLHPKMDTNIVNKYKSLCDNKKIKFIEPINIIDSFKTADVMLCDTSSIIYEFLTQLKPVITFQTEKEEDYLINITDINSLENKMLETLNNPSYNISYIKKAVENFHPYFDGKSSARILNAVEERLNGKKLPIKKKPLNIIRNLKLRKELQYWNFLI
jgi:hypothetical protein